MSLNSALLTHSPYGEEMLRQAFEVHEADEEAP